MATIYIGMSRKCHAFVLFLSLLDCICMAALIESLFGGPLKEMWVDMTPLFELL